MGFGVVLRCSLWDTYSGSSSISQKIYDRFLNRAAVYDEVTDTITEDCTSKCNCGTGNDKPCVTWAKGINPEAWYDNQVFTYIDSLKSDKDH